jgi:CRP-like cAMP-binding protein
MPRSATVIAGTHAELVAVDLGKFLSLIANTPRFALTVMRVITRRVRVMNQRSRAGHGA